jgi:hypothetical protein
MASLPAIKFEKPTSGSAHESMPHHSALFERQNVTNNGGASAERIVCEPDFRIASGLLTQA